MSWFGSPAEWQGVGEGIGLTILAQWAWRAWRPSKKQEADA